MSKTFEDKLRVGAVGEEIVRNILFDQGYVVYEPVRGEAHPFDKVAVKDKTNLYLVEVKTKQSTDKGSYGINVSSVNTYKYFLKEYELPMLVFFVDYNPSVLQIRYTTLRNLLTEIEVDNKKYPYTIKNTNGEVNMFHMNSTKLIRELTEEENNNILSVL